MLSHDIGPVTGYPYKEMLELGLEKQREIERRIITQLEAKECPKESSTTPASSATI